MSSLLAVIFFRLSYSLRNVVLSVLTDLMQKVGKAITDHITVEEVIDLASKLTLPSDSDDEKMNSD